MATPIKPRSDTLKPVGNTSKVTINRTEDGAVTVSGIGEWSLNDSAVTLGMLTSLRGDGSRLEVYTAGEDTAERLKNDLLAYNPNAKIYNVSETESIRGLEDEKLWQNDMYFETPTVTSDNMNYSNKAAVTMIGGAGNDVIVATSGPNEYIDLSKGGKDTIAALNTDTLTVHNYDPKTGATFLMNTKENLVNLIMYGEPYLLVVGDGYFKADNLGRVELEGTDTINGTFVNFTTYDDGDTQLYGWSGQAGGNVDGTDSSHD